ncbi:VWA domain-containing protein [Hymenobacter sp. UYCo722]|uniref:VWA domain-containing protein n=1 Tax=Hymenobacter sp. UYCo722 TaxID=3156335 RepID=UPI003391CF63
MQHVAFQEPAWLWLFLLFPLALDLHLRYWRRQHPTLQFASLPEAQPARPQYLTPPDLLLLLRLLALAGIILALADLRTATTTRQQQPPAGVDIMLTMDISSSMRIEDIKPNRLEGLKSVIRRFVAGRSADRIGLVVYAGESIMWCPLTRDYGYLMQQLNRLDEPALADGTAIGVGLASAVQALRPGLHRSKVIILLTDGENTTGFLEPAVAAELARRNGMRIYTIGIGSMGRAPWPFYDLNGRKTYRYVQVKIDEPALQNMAQRTGGQYFRARDASSLRQIYAQIDHLTQAPAGYRNQTQFTLHYRWFLLAAIGSLALAEILRITLLRSLA